MIRVRACFTLLRRRREGDKLCHGELCFDSSSDLTSWHNVLKLESTPSTFEHSDSTYFIFYFSHVPVCCEAHGNLSSAIRAC